MPRTYVVAFENVAISAAQDLVQVKGAAGKSLRILRQSLACVDSTLPASQTLRLRSQFLPATVTDGSGGSTPTPNPIDPGDAAASFTAKANNTTQASSSGTATTLEANGCHIYSGYDYAFPRPPVIGPSESFVFALMAAPAASTHFSGSVVVEESAG
jgi:hypothetical protein